MGWVRKVWGAQVRLQQLVIDRNAVSGLEARMAVRWLRWNGQRLVGDVLPPYRG